MRLSGAFLFLPTNLPAIEIGVHIDLFQLGPYSAEPSSISYRPSISDLVCNQVISECVDAFFASCPNHAGSDREVRALQDPHGLMTFHS